jgi:flagellar biosynthetic protein FlhB
LAKGKGEIAERIVEVATVHGVPIVRREQLARALYPVVEVGEEIPPKFYRAVAEVIAFVLSRRRIAV